MSSALGKAGVYVIRYPDCVSVSLDRELLILFCPLYPRIIGAVLFDTKAPEKDLYVMLDILYRKTIDNLGVAPDDVAVKVIGMSTPKLSLIEGVTTWLSQKKLRIRRTDAGKGMKRHCLIDSRTGKIGIRCEEPDDRVAGFRLVADVKYFGHGRAKGRRASR